MPSVGTLNLEVRSNASEVGGSLDQIAGALGRIKKAIPEGGLGLSAISEDISKFVTEINKIKNASTAFKQIEQLGNGMRGVAAAIKFSTDSITDVSEKTGKAVSNINTQPLVDAIKKIKSAVGEGFHIGQTGTQLKNIKQVLGEEWNTANAEKVGQVLSTIAEGARNVNASDLDSATTKIRNIASALSEYAQATESLKSAVGGKTQAATNVTETVSQTTKAYSDSGTGGWSRWSHYGSSPQYGSGGTSNAVATMKEIQTEVQNVTPAIREFATSVTGIQSEYQKIDPMQYIGTPLESINDIFRNGASTVEGYKSAIDTVLPKFNALSSEEMVIAKNAEMATKAISALIERLNTVTNKTGAGFGEIVNVMTGVARQQSGGTLLNENTTSFTPITEASESIQKVNELTEGLVKIFDKASGSYKEVYANGNDVAESNNKIAESMQNVQEAEQRAISLLDIPASGKNGVFANASEEMQYLVDKIEQAKQSQQQFNDIAAQAEKQMKYGGPMSKDELAFNLQHATEGYYQAAEAEETYKAALQELQSYVAGAASQIKAATDETAELPVTNSILELNTAAEETFQTVNS